MDNIPFHKKLAEKKKKIGVSLQQIANIVGFHKTTVDAYLKGVLKNTDKLLEIKEALNSLDRNPKGKFIPQPKKSKKKPKKEVKKMILTQSLLDKFGLRKDPFEDGDVPKKEVWKSPNYKTVLNLIVEAANKSNFLLVYGESGTGKSILIQEVLSKLKSPRDIVVYFSPLFIEDFSSSYIAQEMIETISGKKPPSTHRQTAKELAKAVMKATKEKKRITLILDEVHQLRNKILKSLKRFHEGLGVHSSRVAVIMVGQPEIVTELEDVNLREVRRRLSFIELDPFNAGRTIQVDTIRDYIQHKIECAGGKIDIFSEKAIFEIAKRCDTPQSVNEMCSYALYEADLIGDSIVTEDIINGI